MKHNVTMLKTLDGVDEGKIYPTTYHKGESYTIGSVLLDCFVELGGVELSGKPSGAARETKVDGPEETKTPKALNKMSKAELVAHAMTEHGLELIPDTMTMKAMIEAIEAKEAEKAA